MWWAGRKWKSYDLANVFATISVCDRELLPPALLWTPFAGRFQLSNTLSTQQDAFNSAISWQARVQLLETCLQRYASFPAVLLCRTERGATAMGDVLAHLGLVRHTSTMPS